MSDVKFFYTGRGFKVASFCDRNGKRLELKESSLADEPCVWLNVEEDSSHLTIENIKKILPVLQYFVKYGKLPQVSRSPVVNSLYEEEEYLFEPASDRPDPESVKASELVSFPDPPFTKFFSDLYSCQVKAVIGDRATHVTVFVPVKGLDGQQLANALMKAEVLAKRRAIKELSNENLDH